MCELLTNSEMKCFRSCPKMHFYKYVRRLRHAVTAESLRFGSLIHAGLETWWQVSSFVDPDIEDHRSMRLAAAIAVMVDGQPDPLDLAKARPLMEGYEARWGGERYEVLGVEQQFRTALVNPATGAASRTFDLGGKLDGVLRRDGIQIVEHKTATGDIGTGSGYWERLRIDGQVSVYYAGARSLGYDVAGCLYDVIGKVALRPHKATPEADRKYTKARTLYANQREADETLDEYESRVRDHIAENPERYYQRGTVVRLESELADAAYDTWQTARLIREAAVMQRWPRNPDACQQWGRTCDYWPICSGECGEDDPRYRVAERKHEELEVETASTSEEAA